MVCPYYTYRRTIFVILCAQRNYFIKYERMNKNFRHNTTTVISNYVAINYYLFEKLNI
jgi:hypothetical protein